MARPNPYRFPDEWGRVEFSGLVVKALLVAVNGVELEDEWDVQRGIGTTGAVTIWRGTKPVENIVLTFEAPDEATFDDLYAIWDLLKPKPRQRPPTQPIRNPFVNFVGVDKVSRRKWAGPYQVQGFNFRVDLTMIQYKPPILIPAGPAEPAKLPGDPTPKDAAEATFDRLAQEAAALL